MGSAGRVPEHGVLPKRKWRKYSIRARARRADGLAVIVDPEGHSHGVAGEGLQFPDAPRVWAPDHGFVIEVLRSSTGDRYRGGAIRVPGAVLRSSRYFALTVDIAERAVVASQRRELNRHAALQQEGGALQASTPSTKVFIIWVLRGDFSADRSLAACVDSEYSAIEPRRTDVDLERPPPEDGLLCTA